MPGPPHVSISTIQLLLLPQKNQALLFPSDTPDIKVFFVFSVAITIIFLIAGIAAPPSVPKC